jgi:hypothetical protein
MLWSNGTLVREAVPLRERLAALTGWEPMPAGPMPRWGVVP